MSLIWTDKDEIKPTILSFIYLAVVKANEQINQH